MARCSSWKRGSGPDHRQRRAERAKVDAVIADDARGAFGPADMISAIGQCDRLLEVVGDEEYGLAVGRPQVRQEIAMICRVRRQADRRLIHQRKDLGVAN